METIMARGPNFIYAKEFIQEEYGEEIWDKLLRSLPDDVSKIWKRPILVTTVYPFSVFKMLTKELSNQVGTMDNQETALLYEHIADRSLSTVYKVFFRFTNPAFVIRNYPKLWKRFFTTGTVEVPLAESNHAMLRFVLPEIFLDWLSPACYGYSKKAVEMAGGKALKVEKKAQTRLQNGLWEIFYELFWEK